MSRPVALVSGAARRVGREIVLRLADAGFDIAFTFLSSQDLASSLVEQVRAKKAACSAIAADLTSERGPASVFEQFGQSFSRLDLLVNNASLYEPDPADAPAFAAQIRKMWMIHVESPLLLCRLFGPMLQKGQLGGAEQLGGGIVNMLDIQAERPRPGYLAYCASKAGLWNATLGLARELAPHVTVNGIAPGVVQWPADAKEPEIDQYLRGVPLGRSGTPAEVADAVLFLASQARYVTGHVLRLDGGRSIV